MRAGSYFIDHKFVDFSVPIKPDRYQSFQFIDLNKSQKEGQQFEDIFALFVPSLAFLLEYSILIALGVLISISFFKIYFKKPLGLNKLAKLYLNIVFFHDNLRWKISAFTMFTISFVMFNFILRIILSNNIKVYLKILNENFK